MKNKFLGIICLLYSGLIGYVWIFNKIKNYLAPNMQIYLKISFFILLIIGILNIINKEIKYKLKKIDLILILPIIMFIISGNGRLTASLATNRMININDKIENNEELNEEKIDTENKEYDFTNPYFDVKDETYDGLSNYLTFTTKTNTYVGKTIRIRGLATNKQESILDGFFLIGKYLISCCVADASFVGFIVKKDEFKIQENNWYEIEGILERTKDKNKNSMMKIKIINLKEIDSKTEEEYIYPCYTYNSSCEAMSKYNLEK